jgi:phenylacetate-CoA ligase
MSYHLDALETRSQDARYAALGKGLPALITHAKNHSALYQEKLANIDPFTLKDLGAIANLPITRKSELLQDTGTTLRLNGVLTAPLAHADHIFQSPGPIYEIGMRDGDWWRFSRALAALGIGKGDIVQNCFSYHFTPAGMMFDVAAKTVGAVVLPAGGGQTEIQATAMSQLGITAYAGTPDYLKTILEKADELGLDCSALRYAMVSAGPLFPALRSYYEGRAIRCRQCYGTADVGHIAYESDAADGLILDEGVYVEIVRPGSGTPVKEGEIGEVVVTSFNQEMPMIRFATGDLSAFMPGQSACGRTNRRIVGWRGRADQATKVKGMFVRPEQVTALLERCTEINRARITISHDGSNDQMHIQIESNNTNSARYREAVRDIMKLRASVEIVAPNSLPNDGKVIDDIREIG